MTYAKCAIAGTGYVVDGVAKLTAKTVVAAPGSSDYSVGFEATMAGFSINIGGKLSQYEGVLDINSSVTANNVYGFSLAVPAGKTFSDTMSGGGNTPIRLVYNAAATFAETAVVTPNTASLKLDGSVSVGVGSLGSLPLLIATPVALSGTESTGTFVANSGVININSTSRNLATSTTFSGANASVSGDSDGNGSLDLVFDSTWAALVSAQ